jgi:penicillin-binding protein 2
LKEPEILDAVNMSDTTFETVKKGLKDVIIAGTASVELFKRFPVQVGGKTGTAQRFETESDHATFVAFAPYEEPEIAVSVVIENGAHGTWAGYVAEDVLSYYFDVKLYEDLMPQPEEPEDLEESGEVGETGEIEPNILQ